MTRCPSEDWERFDKMMEECAAEEESAEEVAVLREQLRIAEEGLEQFANVENWERVVDDDGRGMSAWVKGGLLPSNVAQEALDKIKEVGE